jgi:DHA1 family inner membrane transport protein
VLTPVLVEVARDFDTSTSTVGQLRAITGLVAGSTALLLGALAARIPLRNLLLTGTALLALGSIVGAAAPSFVVLALAQVPVGVAVALLLSAGVAGAAEWATPEQRPGVLSWALAGQPAAWIVGMPLVGALADTSWRLAVLILPLVGALLAAFALSGCIAGVPSPAGTDGQLTRLLRDRVVAAWAIGELLAFSAWAGTLVYAGGLLIESYSLSPFEAAVVLAVLAAAVLAGNFATKRLLHTGVRRLLIGYATVAAVGVAILGAWRESLTLTVAVLVVLGFVAGGRALAGGALGLDASPAHRLGMMGLRASATQYGYLVGSLLGGAAIAVSGYGVFGSTMGVLFLAAAAPHVAHAVTGRVGSGADGAQEHAS